MHQVRAHWAPGSQKRCALLSAYARRSTGSKRALLILVAAVLLNGCQCRIPVTVSGTLERGIVFALRESREIVHVSVRSRDSAGEWKEIWRLEGKDEIGSVSYSGATAGLATKTRAQALSKNRLYVLHIEDSDFWTGGCVGSLMFVVTAQGTVEECGTDECVRRYR
jgi:hypothetical protein